MLQWTTEIFPTVTTLPIYGHHWTTLALMRYVGVNTCFSPFKVTEWWGFSRGIINQPFASCLTWLACFCCVLCHQSCRPNFCQLPLSFIIPAVFMSFCSWLCYLFLLMWWQVFLINLRRRTDRYNRMMRCIKEFRFDIKWIEAVDGRWLHSWHLQLRLFAQLCKLPPSENGHYLLRMCCIICAITLSPHIARLLGCVSGTCDPEPCFAFGSGSIQVSAVKWLFASVHGFNL